MVKILCKLRKLTCDCILNVSFRKPHHGKMDWLSFFFALAFVSFSFICSLGDNGKEGNAKKGNRVMLCSPQTQSKDKRPHRT